MIKLKFQGVGAGLEWRKIELLILRSVLALFMPVKQHTHTQKKHFFKQNCQNSRKWNAAFLYIFGNVRCFFTRQHYVTCGWVLFTRSSSQWLCTHKYQHDSWALLAPEGRGVLTPPQSYRSMLCKDWAEWLAPLLWKKEKQVGSACGRALIGLQQ